MPTEYEAHLFLDYLASLLQIIDSFPGNPNELFALWGFTTASSYITKRLEAELTQGLPSLLAYLKKLVAKLSLNNKQHRFALATAACIWMDRKISYDIPEPTATTPVVSLHTILPLNGDSPVICTALNTNYVQTGIWLNPKFGVVSATILQDGKEKKKPLANRDAFEGINGQLLNCSYVKYKGTMRINNIVLPYEYTEGREDGLIKIGFSPMSDCTDLLDTDIVKHNRYGMTFRGESLTKIRNYESLQNRLDRDWQLACKANVDVFFCPEMLGSGELEAEANGYNKHIRQLAMKALSRGETPPFLSILPSYWHDGVNSVSIVYQDGLILGKQKKQTPYVDMKNYTEEALVVTDSIEICIIHIRGIHRLAVVTCSDFLALRNGNKSLLCGQLGVTLIIVPSFSHGEQDFINSLTTSKDYGTTVVWGNCCGASKAISNNIVSPKDKTSEERNIIGGCGIAGTDYVFRFGEVCECKQSCQNYLACIFQLDIPIGINIIKPSSPKCGGLKHLLEPKNGILRKDS